jgi:hypothetical protein
MEQRHMLTKRRLAELEATSTRTIERRVREIEGYPQPEIVRGRWYFWSDHYERYRDWRSQQEQKPRQSSLSKVSAEAAAQRTA